MSAEYWDKVRGEVIRQRSGKVETTEPMPVGRGVFGDIYNQFKGKAKEAVKFLMGKKSGEAIGALSHKDIGDIDLVWGKEGTGNSDGYGLAKLVKYHPEVLDNLQEILDSMKITSRSDNRIQLESEKYQAAVRLTWDNERKTWLLTMFEKKNSVPDNTTDTGKTLSSNGNDTATPENTVSAGKGSEVLADKQANAEKYDGTAAGLIANEHTGKLAKSAQTMLDEVAKQTGIAIMPSASSTTSPRCGANSRRWRRPTPASFRPSKPPRASGKTCTTPR